MLTRTMKILLVDACRGDSTRFRRVLDPMDAGRVLRAISAENALDLLERGAVADLVVVVSGGGNPEGADTFRAIRERVPDIPVLAVPELSSMAPGHLENVVAASRALCGSHGDTGEERATQASGKAPRVRVTERRLAELERKKLVSDLNERVKELRCLFSCALLLQEHEKSLEEVLTEIVHMLPAAMQGEGMETRLRAGGVEAQTPGFRETEWKIEASFATSDGRSGLLQVCRSAPPVDPMEPSFIPEERDLLESLADMLRGDLERRAALASLKEREEQFRLLFEENPHPMWVFDSLTRAFLSVNRRAVTKYGYSREEFLSMNIMDIRSGEEAARLREHLATESKGIRDSEIWSHRLKSGEVIQVEVTSSEMRFAGRPARLVLAVDVTRRLEAEAALRAKEARLRTILDTEPECVKVVSLDGCLQDMNASGLRMVGAEHLDQVRGERIIELIDPGHRASYEDLHARAADGVPGQLQYRITGLKGVRRWVETHATPLRNGNGEIESVLSVTRDITDERRARQAFMDAESRFRLLLQSVGEGVYGVDVDGRITYGNPTALAALGYGEEEFTGRDAHELTQNRNEDGLLRNRERSPLFLTLRDGQSRHEAGEAFLRSDGTAFPAEYTCAAVRDESGAVAGAVMVFRDVSERRAAERERQSLLLRERAARIEADAASAYYRSLFEYAPGCYVVISAGDYRIVAASKAYLDATMTDREEIAGQVLFDVFPPGPDDEHSDGLERIREAFDRVRSGGKSEVMAVIRYPIRLPPERGGGYEERYWSSVISPVPGPTGRIEHLILRTEDVTDYLRYRKSGERGDEARMELESRSELIEADVVLRGFELERANQRLAMSQALMRVASRVSKMGGWRVDYPDLTITWTDELRDLFGTGAGFAPDMDLAWSFYDDACEKVIRDAISRCAETGEAWDMECQATAKDGRRLWVRTIGEALRDPKGRIICVHGAIQDITGAKLAEIRERETTRRFLEMAENVQDVFYNFDPAADRFLYVSPAFSAIWGKDCQELYGDPEIYRRSICAEDRGAVVRFANLLMAGSICEIEFRILRPDGEMRWVRDRAYPVKNECGDVVRIVGTARDITESRNAEAMLHVSDERFRMLARATNDAIWDWDHGTDRIWWNEGMQKLFGYSESDIKPSFKWWAELLHPDDRDRVVSHMKNFIEGGESTWSSEHRFQCKSGKYAYVLDRGHVIRDDSGKSVRMIGSMTDLTERKNLEEQLFQTQKLNAIGLLAGGVAHDFNNLLCVINGYSEILMSMTSPEDERRAMISEVRDAGERAANLTRQLLAFSRKQVLAPTTLCLNEVVSSIARMVSRLLGEDVRMSTVLDPAIPSIRVDQGQLEQVIINLAVNARDAMPKGGRLTIESKRVKLKAADVAGKLDLKPGNYVALLVSDTGCGIRREVLPKIFEPFFTTKELGKGTGLGLSTVFGIVKQSEGSIDVYSEPGFGTCFKILFPAVGEGSKPAGTRESVVDGGSETVLLVEDEAGVRGIAKLALESQGYRVVEASNGAVALERVKTEEGRIHVLVTDVVMPEMGGRELVLALREMVPGLRVVYMSGYTDDAVVRHGIIEASEVFLQKPFQPMMLARKVREALDR